jgi:type I restriction enzyme S subunit
MKQMKLAWNTAAIGEVVERAQTWNPSRFPVDEVFQYIDLSAVDQEAKAITGAREVPCGEAPSRARQLVESGDILVSTVRPNLNGVACVPGQLDGATASTGFCVLRASKTKASSAYLFHWVKSPMFIADMVTKATGASYPAVSDRIIFDAQIPLPPLAEQKRIAAILDAADALRTKRREALAQLDALLQSTFLTLFGDPVANPMGWPTASFDDCLQDLTSSAIKIPKSDFQLGGQWQIIDQSQNEIAGYSDIGPPFTQALPAVVFGDHTRCVKLVRQPFLLGADGAKLLVPRKQMLSVFLSYLLPLLKLPDLGYSRHMREVKRLVYPLPPLPLQQKFAAIVESVERQKAAQRAHLAELDALFAALQHRAFRGEL